MSIDSFQDRMMRSPVVMTAGAVLGAVLILASVGLLFGVESKAIGTTASMEQGASLARTVSPERVDPANDGKLVHLIGEATTSEALTDPDFRISTPTKALRLGREVEVYVWKESKSESKKDKTTSTTYTYTQAWSKEKPATKFAEPAGHTNPADKPYADNTINATDVKVGAFTLTPSQVERIPVDEDLKLTNDMLSNLPPELQRGKVDSDGRFFMGFQERSKPDAPKVGDARIRFKVAKPQTITLVAKQTQSTFEPYHPEAGEAIDLLKPGSHDAQTLLEAAQASGRTMTWLLRLVSLLLLTLGVALVIRRQAFVASGDAPEGVAANVTLAVLAAGVSLAVVLLVMGIRWLFYQPGFGAGLLAAGLVVFAALFFVARGRKTGPLASLFRGAKQWSPQERDHLHRIALDPENAQLRLEFAASLEKSGDPMGEFIRIDHELEAIPEGDARRENLDRRWSELLQANGRKWFAPLRKLRLEPSIAGTFFPSLWMHHGIIDEVKIDLPGILPEKADQLFAAAPGLRVLEFHNIHMEPGLGGWKDTMYDPDVAAIVRVPQLKQIAVLKMSSLSMKLDDLRAIATSPNLENLTELDFSYNSVGPEGAVLIAQSSTLKRLRVLELRACDIGEQGAVALAGSPNLGQLVTLNLGANAIGRGGASALAASVYLKHLQTLAVDDNSIGPIGAQALAGSPHLRQLTSLDLGRNEIGVEGALALGKSANLAKVTALKLNDNRLGGGGLRFLAGSPHLGPLEILELESNEINDEGALALASCAVIKQLKELSLSYNNIGDAGFKALASWPGLARLNKLSLRQNKSGAEGIKALAGSPHLRGLESLDVSNNDVGVAGAQALASSPALTNLKYLWIHEANLTSEGEELLRQRFGDVVQVT